MTEYEVQCYHDWHRPYENNLYINEVLTSIPPKYEWTCSKCNKVIYVPCSVEKPKSEDYQNFMCQNCNKGEYHGFSKNVNSINSIYFWCPIKNHHDCFHPICKEFVSGLPKRFDKFNNLLG